MLTASRSVPVLFDHKPLTRSMTLLIDSLNGTHDGITDAGRRSRSMRSRRRTAGVGSQTGFFGGRGQVRWKSAALILVVGSLIVASGCARRTVIIREAPPPAESEVYIPAEPPPAQVETPPPQPIPGSVWVPGHWRWDGVRYVWMTGHWDVRPRGATWVPGHWRRAPRGWVWMPGHWR
jgi:hypothetical protein